MERLITVKAVSERYDCSMATARKYIRQCNPHMENPLVTYDWAFKEWEQSRTKASKQSMTDKDWEKLFARVEQGAKVKVPRTRD